MQNRSFIAALAAAATLLAGCSMPKAGSDNATYYYSNKGASAVAPVRPVPMAPASQVGPQGVARIVYFDFDHYVVKPEYRGVVEAHANFLKARRGAKVTLEGHTDERGGREYNLALGQRRAEAVRNALTVLGVSDSQIDPVSWGVEKPASLDRTEQGYQLNRRVEFTYR
ncbi:peptidoglycan-associated lipoprotein Pal [Variovorax ginsengisoli]|uniref:Peptidoglycan-associated lipoprotein n=1 Tax=Variovorax ginsengisoli TaxID=363844 RepID=A0ABT9SEM7_9BURK|nr:peptidoglycan-associated lipoprotein Pal [Variovorax ginsengisoli]MDP9902344.1 peptidoglycan-associated lipoprotein [Variovorax ginsengisoli]